MQQQVARIVEGRLIPRDEPATPAPTWLQAPDERPLSPGAMRLILAGIPPRTRETYEHAWRPYDAWCEAQGLNSRPSAESTMLHWIDRVSALPVHNRCAGGRQANGEKCGGHRPAPSTLWIWYSAVRFYHSMPAPPFAWFGGKRLALAMKGFCDDAVNRLGWEPNQAPRAWPQHVMAMADAIDLDDPAGVRDWALILANWATAGRASDLSRYRTGDLTFTPDGLVNMVLRSSKTNKETGKKIEYRVLHPDPDPDRWRYCPVTAMRRYVYDVLRDGYGVRQGALFRPFVNQPGSVTGLRGLLRGHRDDPSYRMASVSLSGIVQSRAVEAGIDGGEFYTCHSLRRGRATDCRRRGFDRLSIARAFGWNPNSPSLNVYFEEAEASSSESPASVTLTA